MSHLQVRTRKWVEDDSWEDINVRCFRNVWRDPDKLPETETHKTAVKVDSFPMMVRVVTLSCDCPPEYSVSPRSAVRSCLSDDSAA